MFTVDIVKIIIRIDSFLRRHCQIVYDQVTIILIL